MAEKKSQHYVPRFYLKLFSNNNEGTHIGLYNFRNTRFVPAADLRHQACRDYFYGKDSNVEDALGVIEGHANLIIKGIIDSKQMPELKSENYNTIWLFTLIQAYRTKYTANEANNMVNMFFKTILKYDDKFKNHLNDFTIELTNAPTLMLTTLIQSLDEAVDLSCKLIVNNTKINFITSDNPVVRYNQFLEKRNSPSGRTGLATKGLQIFYPISPNLTLIFYDSKVYNIGNKKYNVIDIQNEIDVEFLNLLQSLNCDEQIYFNNKVSQEEVNKIIGKKNKLSPKTKNVMIESSGRQLSDGNTSKLIHYTKDDHEINLKLSFIKETLHAQNYIMSGYLVELRNKR